jgi:Na+/proline symporter
MSWIDWCIVVVPLTFLLFVAFYSQKYVKSVVDFLAAGRVAGRYLLSVGDFMSTLSVITLIAGIEMYYQTGFSITFWNHSMVIPLNMIIALTGFIVYRWRETKCLSLGQFLELRYGSKFFRVFCSSVRTFAEIMTNAIGPAVATNFFIYYLGLPHKINIFGVNLPCFAIIVVMCLVLAVLFIWPSGRISLIITDSIQGLMSYPIFIIIAGYVLLHFGWFEDISPVMINRVDNQSFINPYDIEDLRDFNLFSVFALFIFGIMSRGVWLGNDNASAGRTPHEQKMAGVIAAWRVGMSFAMIIVLSLITITFMNSKNFSTRDNYFGFSHQDIREELSDRVLSNVVADSAKKDSVLMAVKNQTETPKEFFDKPFSQQSNLDTIHLATVRDALGDTPESRLEFQKYRSLYNQMMAPVLLRNIFPVGLVGLFCLLMIMILISTDDSRIFNSSATMVQDIILPMFKKQISPKLHLLILRLSTVFVAIIFLIGSLCFANLDYLNMYVTIMAAVWTGGAGAIMLFGLYSRFGNLAGAWCSLIFGSGISVAGVLGQRYWAKNIYPFLENHGWIDDIDSFLRNASAPFDPWIKWSMDPTKFPINSYEITLLAIILSVIAYVIGSLVTYKPYDLDKLLHRGIYSDGEKTEKEKFTVRKIFAKLIGITPEHTKGDKFIAYAVFIYSFVYSFGVCFLLVVIWNAISPWDMEYWSIQFFITMMLVPMMLGLITTIWFMIGGIIDIKRLFVDLEKKVADDSDNGQILK